MSEYKVQSAFVKWIRYQYPNITIFHIPNGEKRDIRTASKLKSMGVLKGVYDLYIVDYKLFIEVKKSKREKLSPAQEEFKKKVEKSGHHTLEVYGLEDAIGKFKTFIDNLDAP